MRQITILSIDEDSSQFYKRQLHSIFKDIAVDYRNLEMEPIPPIYHTDLILYTDPEIINLLIGKIKCDVPQLMMKRTISRAALKEINRIEPDSDVLVVNIPTSFTLHRMSLSLPRIFAAGRLLRDIDFWTYPTFSISSTS